VSDPAGAAGLTAAERSVLDAVDRDWIVGLLADLVAIPSVGAAETPAQERVAAEMRGLGLEVDVWDIDMTELCADPDYSAEVERDEALGVVGICGDDGPALMLNGHVDVVPIGDEALWSAPPWTATMRGDRLYGRGTADMKGGLVCALAAIRALRSAGVEPGTRTLIASVVAEEDGGAGTLATLRRGHTADAAVIVEPTAGRVCPSQAGALGFRLIVPGAPAHGAVRNEGVSAVEKFELVHAALRNFEARRNAAFADPLFSGYELPLSLSIGTIRAGEWSSTVPDTLVAEGRYGVGPRESPESGRRAFEDAVASVDDPWLTANPVRVEWWGGQFHPRRRRTTTPSSRPSSRLTEPSPEPPLRSAAFPTDRTSATWSTAAASRACCTGPATPATPTGRTSTCPCPTWWR
jgi:acetylornithine deacetylase